MSQCITCGAAGDANFLTCQYCGAASDALDPAQELQALRELAATAQEIGSTSENLIMSEMLRMGVAEGSGKLERIAKLWTNAFVPLTFEAQHQALLQVVSAFTTSGRADHAGKHSANEALIRRGEVLIAAMDGTVAADSALAARAAVIKTQFQQSRDAAENLKKKGYKQAHNMMAGVGVFFLLFLFGMGWMWSGMMSSIDNSAEPSDTKTVYEGVDQRTITWDSNQLTLDNKATAEDPEKKFVVLSGVGIKPSAGSPLIFQQATLNQISSKEHKCGGSISVIENGIQIGMSGTSDRCAMFNGPWYVVQGAQPP
jgi:hypothetical protein